MATQQDYSAVYEQIYRSLMPPQEDPWVAPIEETWNWEDTQKYLDPLFQRTELFRPYPLPRTTTYVPREIPITDIMTDLIGFFNSVKLWVVDGWLKGEGWVDSINDYITKMSDNIRAAMAAVEDSLVRRLESIANFIQNMSVAVIWQLFEDVQTFATNLFNPFVKWFNWIVDTLSTWLENIWDAIRTFLDDPAIWIVNLVSDFTTWMNNIIDMVWNAATTAAQTASDLLYYAITPITDTLTSWLSSISTAIRNLNTNIPQWIVDLAGANWPIMGLIKDAIWGAGSQHALDVGISVGDKITAAVPLLVEQAKEMFLAIWDTMKAALVWVTDDLIPAVTDATSGAIGWIKDEFTRVLSLAYDDIMEKATALVPVTPERSATVALGMFGSAVSFGTLAHSMALAVEAIPNLKYMGVHYLSAFVARMGSFGTISSATVGVIAGLAIRTPFTYYMKSILRPEVPGELDLQMMAVKPDIPIEVFRQNMAYHGYSDYWIDAYERTMFHEPSYFELSMLGEDESADSDWIFTKARRRGYSQSDALVFVRSLVKKITRDQRKSYFTESFRAYKEGYIGLDSFEGNLDLLDMRPEAKDFAVLAADLAYQSDLFSDLVSMHRRSFQDGLTTKEELRVALSALGMVEERVDTIVAIEVLRQQPKIAKAEQKAIESRWRDIQSEYSKVYIESFRRGLITQGQLAAYLIAIGIEEPVATATAALEEIKRVPKPKGIEITVPQLPEPPSPPVYQE